MDELKSILAANPDAVQIHRIKPARTITEGKGISRSTLKGIKTLGKS